MCSKNLKTDDWAVDNATITPSNNGLLTGCQRPNCHANVFGISLAYTGG